MNASSSKFSPFHLALLAGVLMLLGFYLMSAGVIGDNDDSIAWLTVNFLFLLGLSQFGTVFMAILRLCYARWPVGYYRTAEMLTLVGVPIAVAGFALIYVFGRQQLFHWLGAPKFSGDPWLQESGLVWRFVIGQSLFYALALWGYHLGKQPDKTRTLYRLASWQLVAFVIANTLLAWDFGMLLHDHWLSSVYPIHFFMGSVFGGFAIILLLTTINKVPIAQKSIENFGRVLIGFALLWLYFFWAQYIVFWFGNLPQELGPMQEQMSGRYGMLFWLMLACLFIIPFFTLLSYEVRSKLSHLAPVALLIVVGVWLHRVLTVIPVMDVDISLIGIMTSIAAALMVFAAVSGLARRAP